MNQRINARGLSAAILTMSVLQMSTNAISSILAAVAQTFPNASPTQVQFLMTFPFLFVVTVSLLVGLLSGRLNRKLTAAVGLALGGISGLGAYFVHTSLPVLYFWSGLLGTGIGLVVPVCTSLIAVFYEGKARENMLGYQTSACNVFSMVMTYLGGVLAGIAWHCAYLVYLFVIPGLILTLMFVPSTVPTSPKAASGQSRLPIGVYVFCLIGLVHMLLFFIGPTNIAMLVAERGLGNEMTAGTVTSCLLVSGILGGLVFGRLAAKIGKMTIPVGYLALAIGFALLNAANNTILLYIGALIAGLSNAFIMPQCMGSAAALAPSRATLVNSLIFSTANIGTFIAPLLTNVAAAISGSPAVGPRFLLAAALSAIGGILLTIVAFRWNREK